MARTCLGLDRGTTPRLVAGCRKCKVETPFRSVRGIRQTAAANPVNSLQAYDSYELN